MSEVLVCPRTAAGPSRVADAMRERCSRCGVEVWVAPSGQALIVRLRLTILCHGCVRKAEQRGEAVVRMPLQPEQIAERRRRGGL